MFFKVGVLKNLANLTKKILYPVLEFLFNEVAGLNRFETLLKRDSSTRVFPWTHEIDEIFKNTFFYRTPLVATSEIKNIVMISFLFETYGFTNNPNFIPFKWKLKKKHSLIKCIICETEICQIKICLKASLLLSCKNTSFILPTMIFLFSFIYTSVRFISLLPCYKRNGMKTCSSFSS